MDDRSSRWNDRLRRLQSFVRGALLAVLRWPSYLLVGFVPKDPNLWLVGSWSGHRFADNAKWLFLYLTAPGRNHGTRVVWISRRRAIVQEIRNLGRPAEFLWSPRGLWAAMRAGVHIIDADTRGIAFWASRRVTIVNLFHGIALKRIGADVGIAGHHITAAFHGSIWERLIMRALAPWFTEPYALLIASSPTNAAVMTSAFKADADTIAVTGLPRNDILRLTDDDVRAVFGVPADPPTTSVRSVLYAPTFRDFDRAGRPLPIEWDSLSQLMLRHDAVFLLKLHPHDAARLPKQHEFERIVALPPDQDVYPVLRHVDVLITDYSSIFFDYLLCDKPMIFYPYDIDQYRSRDREFYYPYEEVTPGDHARSFAELMRCLDEVLSGRDEFADARRQTSHRFHATEVELSCKAVTQRVLTLTS